MSDCPILFKNSEIVVVDKPVGISIHNADSAAGESDLLEIVSEKIGVPSVFPVHRLDKETSGVQILALSREAAGIWAQEFQFDRVEKFYEGITRGALKDQEGTWHLKISDRAEGRNNPAGLAGNRVSAETKFRVLASNRYFSHCEFQLLTGRQHQIRKHCALAKHALVGDRRYGDLAYNRRMESLYRSDRMFLHSTRLRIRGETFESPLPLEFQNLMKEVTRPE